METIVQQQTSRESPPVFPTVCGWLDAGMRQAGHGAALCFGERTLTHAELDRLSNRIANHLILCGVQPGDRIGLCLDRSIEMVAALLGILKAGAAYVPLDPEYPRERLAMMQEDSRQRFLLIHRAFVDHFNDAASQMLVWEDIQATVDEAPSTHPGIEVGPEAIAYIIFTSGSTGRPKGIAMPHRALSNLIEWQLERKGFVHGARVLQYSSISFDVSFQEVATTLASGGTLCLISNEDRRDPRKLLEHLINERIGRLFLPYVAMRSMVEAAIMTATYPVLLKETITAGEQLRIDEAVRSFFANIGNATLDNQYGPSETHVITANLLEGDPALWPELPSIGTVLKNCRTHILDGELQPVPPGGKGELYLGGRNLALGYFGRDDLTHAAFVADPFGAPGSVLYKTGDLASYQPDGSIEFLGRSDHQIKIRGHRIEPGEINNAVSAFPGVSQCLTHAFKGGDGVLQLSAYYTVRAGESVDNDSLRNHLAGRLPDYMVPAFLIELDGIPYTPSGKVDLKSLPSPSVENSQYAGESCAYQSSAEEQLARIWSDVLGLENIPRTADFFRLGGDSLRAVTLFLKIQQQFDREFPLAVLAHTSTIAGIARLIDGPDAQDVCIGGRSLQLLQKGDDELPPLFLIHGGKGNVLIFHEFVRGLDARQPVYGFQWSGWDGRPGERTIGEMARAYKEEILRFAPRGSCRLGGNCIGGLIAIELAGLLEKEGISIEGPLLVWDSPNVKSRTYQTREPWGRKGEMASFDQVKIRLIEQTIVPGHTSIAAEPEATAGGFVGMLQRTPFLRRLVQWSKTALKWLPVHSARLRGKGVPMDRREFVCLRTMLSAVRRHSGSVYPGDVLYFRSHSVLARDFGIPGWWTDPYLGFGELCGGQFKPYVVGRQHNTIFDVPEICGIVNESFSNQINEQER